MQFLCFRVSRGSVETIVTWSGEVNLHLIAHSFTNCQNRLIGVSVKVIVYHISDISHITVVFLRHSVFWERWKWLIIDFNSKHLVTIGCIVAEICSRLDRHTDIHTPLSYTGERVNESMLHYVQSCRMSHTVQRYRSAETTYNKIKQIQKLSNRERPINKLDIACFAE